MLLSLSMSLSQDLSVSLSLSLCTCPAIELRCYPTVQLLQGKTTTTEDGPRSPYHCVHLRIEASLLEGWTDSYRLLMDENLATGCSNSDLLLDEDDDDDDIEHAILFTLRWLVQCLCTRSILWLVLFHPSIILQPIICFIICV